MGDYGHSPTELVEATRIQFTANAAYAIPPPNMAEYILDYTAAAYCDFAGASGAYVQRASTPVDPLIKIGNTAAEGLLRSIVFFDSIPLPAQRVGSAFLEFTAPGGDVLVRDLTDVANWDGYPYDTYGIFHGNYWDLDNAGLDLYGITPELNLDDISHVLVGIDPSAAEMTEVYIMGSDTGGQPWGSLYEETPPTGPTVYAIPVTPTATGRLFNTISINAVLSGVAKVMMIRGVSREEGFTTSVLSAAVSLAPNAADPSSQAIRYNTLSSRMGLNSAWDLSSPWTPGATVRTPDIGQILSLMLLDNAYTEGQPMSVVIESMFQDNTYDERIRECLGGCDIQLLVNPPAV